MNGNRVHLVVVDPASMKFDKAIECLLISLLAFAPFAFGAVEAWSEETVLVLSGAISICFVLKLLFVKNARVVWSWAYVPVGLFLVMAVLQLIPLPGSIIGAFSPNTAVLKNELLADLPNSVALPESMTLSFYPNATRHDLRIVFAVVSVFFVVLNVYRRPDQMKRLLLAIAGIGGFMALLALAQDLCGNGRLYWVVPSGQDSGPYSGTFINHSHYGQFMNLSIGAALGLLMVKTGESFAGRRITPSTVAQCINSPYTKVAWFLFLAIIIGAATVLISLTRGGMLSMLIASGITGLALGFRRPTRITGWLLLLAAFAAFMAVVYIGFDPVYDRIASLRQIHQAEGGRLQILKDIAGVCVSFPTLGTGLGTHEVVFPMFDRSGIPLLAAYAENEYAQIAEETGLAGLSTLIAFGIMVWASFLRIARRGKTPISLAAYGLGFGLMAILVHSLTDFGQHLPANAMLPGTFCALLLALPQMDRRDIPQERASFRSLGATVMRICVVASVCGGWTWILFDANNARLAEAHWAKAQAIEQGLLEEGRPVNNDEYLDLISNAAAAAEYQPQNIKYRHWLNVYRWWSLSGISDPNTGEVVLPEYAIEIVRSIVSELHHARLTCPTYGAIYCVVGQLERSVLQDPNGANSIRAGFRLAPNDPAVCFVAGLLDLEEGNAEAACTKLNRSVKLDGRFFIQVAGLYVDYLERPDLAVELAGESTSRLSHVANLLADTNQHQALAEQARSRVVNLLKSRCHEDGASAEAFASLAKICRKQQNNEAAIEYYRRALALDYGRIVWRLALTRLLAETDRIPEAIREARICVRLGPHIEAAEELLSDLSVLPGAATGGEPTPWAGPAASRYEREQ